MFGVVICPKCGQARGIRLSTKKTKCPRCSSTFTTNLLKIYFLTDKEAELAEAVRTVAAEGWEGGTGDPDSDHEVPLSIGDNKKRIQEKASKDEIDEISIRLIEEKGSFTLDEFEDAVRERFPSQSDRIMSRLRKEEKRGEEWSGEFDAIEASGFEERLTSREERIIDAASHLTETNGWFSKDDLKKALNIAAKDEIDALMAKLLEKGIITEVSIGIFRLV